MRRLSGPGWSNQEGAGYEISSKGDKRFSALYARLPDGRLIEDAWAQAKGYPDRHSAKGRPALTPDFDYDSTYIGLWRQWAEANPELLADLAAKAQGQVLVDRFAKTENNQARTLAQLLSELRSEAAAAPPAPDPQPRPAPVAEQLALDLEPLPEKRPAGSPEFAAKLAAVLGLGTAAGAGYLLLNPGQEPRPYP